MNPQQPNPPIAIRFCCLIKSIAPDFEAQVPRYSKPPHPLWLPPRTTNAFKVLQSGRWFQWSPGSVSAVPQNLLNKVQIHSTTSLFWCHDRQAFLQVPYDCTEKNVKEVLGDGVPLDWDVLSFHHKRIPPGPCISILGYKNEKNELCARGSPAWMPQLLPEKYQCPKKPEHDGSCQLAGELSILLGLVAFSTTPDRMLEVIQNSFRNDPTRTNWTPHGNSQNPSKSSTAIHTTDTDIPKGKTNEDSWSKLVSYLKTESRKHI
jgi:hypothetical protein